MQQLGISPNAPKSQSRIKELLWPEIGDVVAAHTAARNAMYVSFFIAAMTFLVALITSVYVALVDALLFVIIGMFIRNMSRVAAVAGLALYLWEQVAAFAAGRGAWNVILVVLIAAVYVSAIRATWSYARLKQEHNMAEIGQPTI